MHKIISGNQLTLLQNGTEYFPALEAAIDQATQHVYLECYIFADDATGQRIAAALMRAAQRGVATHLLIDGFGAQAYPARALQALRAAGVNALIYRPQISPFRFQRQRMRRLHRKLSAIDQRYAFVGGINIVNDIPAPGMAPRCDYAVRVEGPLVMPILHEVRDMHARVAWTQLHTARHADPITLPTPQPAGEMRAEFLLRSNLRHRREIEHAYVRAIGNARQEIIIANAYFLPSRRFRRALINAAARGVRVTLLLQGMNDHPWVHYASRSLYDRLLSKGVEIYEYQPSELHAKVAVVDCEWATVGSSNLDPLSLVLSREANVAVYDQAFARQLEASLKAALSEHSKQITHVDWKSRSRWEQLKSRLVFAVLRGLAAWVGYGMGDG
jgi:cardiolipin synthase